MTFQPEDPDERREFITHQLAAREAAARAQRLEVAARLLEPAIRAARLAGLDTASLESTLVRIEGLLADQAARRGDRIAPRTRPAFQKEWRQDGPRRRF